MHRNTYMHTLDAIQVHLSVLDPFPPVKTKENKEQLRQILVSRSGKILKSKAYSVQTVGQPSIPLDYSDQKNKSI